MAEETQWWSNAEDTNYGIVDNQWNEGYDPIVSGSSAFTPAITPVNTSGNAWGYGNYVGNSISDLWSTVRPESTSEYTPNTNVMPGYRVKYNAAGNATGVEPIPTSSPTSRTQSGSTTDRTQTIGGNTHQTQAALGTTAPRTAPENQAIYSYSASEPSYSTTTGISVNNTRKIPTMVLPSYTEVPAISMPSRDPMRERVLAQEEASLGVGEWRQSIRSGLNKVMSEGNFASRGSQIRQLFSGAGQALGRILQSASASARQQYNAEYLALANAAVESYRGQIQQRLSNFQAQMSMYLATMNTISSQDNTQKTKTTGGQQFSYKGTTPYQGSTPFST